MTLALELLAILAAIAAASFATAVIGVAIDERRVQEEKLAKLNAEYKALVMEEWKKSHDR